MSKEKPSPDTQKKAQNPQKPSEDELLEEKSGFENRPEPTRYGDWDVNGRCSDF